MNDIQPLEKYFDELMQPGANYPETHPLADMGARFERYKTLRLYFEKMAVHLGLSQRFFYGKYSRYQTMLNQFSQTFASLAKMQDDQLDFYVRMITVEQLTVNKNAIKNNKGHISQMLGYLTEGLLAVLFDKKDSIRVTVKEVIQHFAQPAFLAFLPLPMIQLWEDKKLRDWLKQALIYYEKIEECLLNAHNGIIARDKKMLIDLRHLKMGLGKVMLQAAMSKQTSKTTGMSDYLLPVTAILKDKHERESR
jgi:hypothetical protein